MLTPHDAPEGAKRREYDEICNACGKEIHPPRQPILESTRDVINWTVEQSKKQQDCVWIERHNLRGGGYGHPLTNYICRACNEELERWLQQAGVR